MNFFAAAQPPKGNALRIFEEFFEVAFGERILPRDPSSMADEEQKKEQEYTARFSELLNYVRILEPEASEGALRRAAVKRIRAKCNEKDGLGYEPRSARDLLGAALGSARAEVEALSPKSANEHS